MNKINEILNKFFSENLTNLVDYFLIDDYIDILLKRNYLSDFAFHGKVKEVGVPEVDFQSAVKSQGKNLFNRIKNNNLKIKKYSSIEGVKDAFLKEFMTKIGKFKDFIDLYVEGDLTYENLLAYLDDRTDLVRNMDYSTSVVGEVTYKNKDILVGFEVKEGSGQLNITIIAEVPLTSQKGSQANLVVALGDKVSLSGYSSNNDFNDYEILSHTFANLFNSNSVSNIQKIIDNKVRKLSFDLDKLKAE